MSTQENCEVVPKIDIIHETKNIESNLHDIDDCLKKLKGSLNIIEEKRTIPCFGHLVILDTQFLSIYNMNMLNITNEKPECIFFKNSQQALDDLENTNGLVIQHINEELIDKNRGLSSKKYSIEYHVSNDNQTDQIFYAFTKRFSQITNNCKRELFILQHIMKNTQLQKVSSELYFAIETSIETKYFTQYDICMKDYRETYHDLMHYAVLLKEPFIKSSPYMMLQLLIEVIHALKVVHDHGIIHGDIKFENILINKDFYKAWSTRRLLAYQEDLENGLVDVPVRIIDWETSFIPGHTEYPTKIFGTAEYIPPEVFNIDKYYQMKYQSKYQNKYPSMFKPRVTTQKFGKKYINDDITTAIDVFAIGILIIKFYNRGIQIPKINNNITTIPTHGEILDHNIDLMNTTYSKHEDVIKLTELMVETDHTKRPTMQEIYDELITIKKNTPMNSWDI